MRRPVLAPLALALACAGTAPPPPAAPPPAREAGLPLADSGWGEVQSARFLLAIPLPEAKRWSVDDRGDRWFSASHPGTRSMLWARSWRAGGLVTHRDCEAEARPLRRDLFGRDEGALVSRRSVPAPEGFDTEVGFALHRKGDSLGGVAVAIGARLRRCLVVAFATRADGAGADHVVAARLALVASRSFTRLAVIGVEDRVVPLRR